jgi:hypothetical protein
MCKPCYDKWLKANNPAYRQRQLENTARWIAANPEKNADTKVRRVERQRNDPAYKSKRRANSLKKKYGITLGDYDRMFLLQNGSCAICTRRPGAGKHLHVDHSHDTGKVRGLLCHQCNWYLGTIEADDLVLTRLVAYLEGTTHV